jgi:hypothetical protein
MSNDIKKIVDNNANEAEWKKYFIQKNSELMTEYSSLLYGVKTKLGHGYRRVGYERLRDFFDGDQWLYVPEGGQPMKVYNYCRNTVFNYTAFMTNEPIDIDVPAVDITDEVEVARAEAKEKVLREILVDNKFEVQFEAGVQNGSLLGDTIILGPFYDSEEKRIWFQNVKRPENVRIIWADDTFTEIFGFIHYYYISEEKAYQLYPKLKESEVKLVTVELESSNTGSAEKTGRVGQASSNTMRRMVELMDCWTDEIHMLMVGTQVVDFENHGFGFVPIEHVPNIIHPTEPFGISDIEDLLDPQVEYNERSSDMSEVISQTAFPYIFGRNLDPVEVQSGTLNLIDIGDEGELQPDPRGGQAGRLENELARRKSSMFEISGLNENIFGGSGVRAVTGRALSVLMQSVNNRIKGRQNRWTIALQDLFENIFLLIEKFEKNGKELVGGFYKTDIFFPGTLLRNTTDEINKFNAKLQSQETTMKNLGVPSPKDERKIMKEELSDQMLMVELSRNPGLQMQIKQMLQQQIANNIAGEKPMMREDENMEEAPSANGGAPQQSAVSPDGAVNQTNQRAGASVARESEEG